MLKYDSTHGQFKGDIRTTDSELIVNDKIVKFYTEKDPGDIPWSEACASFIIESTGIFKSIEKARAHLRGGAKRS